jgi:hypothetical protein
MSRGLAGTIVLLTGLVLVGCNHVDLDVPLSDEKTSVIDPALLGIWTIAPQLEGPPGLFFVGKKKGTERTLDVAAVGLEQDLTLSAHHFDMFARVAKHRYLTIGDAPPEPHTIGPKWLLARYEIASNDTVQVQLLNYDAFRVAVRRAVLEKRLKGEIKGGKRRRSEWVFAMPGTEQGETVFTDSSESLVRFLDEQGDALFEKPTIFKRSSPDTPEAAAQRAKLAGAVRPIFPLPADTQPAKPAHDPGRDDFAPELPQSFEIMATLPRPGEYQAGKLEAFRSVALRLPWVYVLDRTGTVCVFRLPKNGPAKDLQPTKILENLGDGDDLKVFGDVLVCTRLGALEAYRLKNPTEPVHIGTFGAKTWLHFEDQRIVRNGPFAFLLCGTTIQSYDLTVPAQPKLLAKFQAKQSGWVGAADGNYLYVGQVSGGHLGVCVYDVSSPKLPLEVGFVPLSHPPYSVFVTPQRRLVVGMYDGKSEWISESHIVVNGRSAVFDLADPKRPRLTKQYDRSGGVTAALLNAKGQSYFACNGVVFALTKDGLEPNSVFLPLGTTMDALPYHGDSEGNYAAVTTDQVVQVLRLKDAKSRGSDSSKRKAN